MKFEKIIKSIPKAFLGSAIITSSCLSPNEKVNNQKNESDHDSATTELSLEQYQKNMQALDSSNFARSLEDEKTINYDDVKLEKLDEPDNRDIFKDLDKQDFVDDLERDIEISKIVLNNADVFLKNTENYTGVKGLDLPKQIKRAGRENPASFFLNIKSFKGVKDLDLVGGIMDAAEQDPRAFLYCSGHFPDDFRNIKGFDLQQAREKISKQFDLPLSQ